MAENNNEIEINSNNDVSSKRKRPIDVVDIDVTTSNATTTTPTTTTTTTTNNNNNNNNSSKSSTNMNDNKKLKTELQTVVNIAGEILLSLLPENKTKEFPEPSMRRLNLAQQIFERNNKIIDGTIYIINILILSINTNNFLIYRNRKE